MRPVAVSGEPEGLILFDGVCVFCSGWTRWVIRRDPQALFRFVAIQSERGRALAARVGLDPENPVSNAVIVGGQALFKSDATLAVVSRLPGWRWVGVFRIFPKGVRDWLYDRAAKNRYRLFGRTETCWVPEAGDRERFLT